MRNSSFWWFLIGFMVLLDFYCFQAVKLLTQNASDKTRSIIHIAYWTISILSIVTLLLLPYLYPNQQTKLTRTTIFALIFALFFAKLIAAVFFLIDDIRRGIQWIAGKIFYRDAQGEALQQGERISRSVFLTWAGLAMGGGLFGTLIYGFGNKYRYQVKRIKLRYSNLPLAFKGLKIVQLSDIHSGSFNNKEAVKKGVQKVLNENPDIILFTGDLVNNIADEMKNYIDVFDKVQAPLGVYSVLGNHDYGDYARWETTEAKAANLEQLKQVHTTLGWRLLNDENIAIEKDGEQIGLIGVQNISGRTSFHSYGDLQKAYSGAEKFPFKILMSHDPSHWDAEVTKKYQDIDLTLSGHTHGFQFGVEIPGFKWSPVQYVYKQWAGLYEYNNQKLYINRGFGFLGYPGRVGILPEITVIELD